MYLKRILLLIILILQIVILSTTSAFAKTTSKDENKLSNKPNSYYYKQFKEVFERIQENYVQEPDLQDMTDEAVSGMLRSLDPYSEYYTDEDLEFFLSNTEGEFGGIGVQIIYDNGAVKVISPIDDLPAYKAGIRAGDYIIGVNGELVSNMGFKKAVREMRGKPGTVLNLLVLKVDENKPKEIELKREIVKIKPIKYHLEENKEVNIAYIRISAFNKTTIRELKKAVKELEKQSKEKNKNIEGIILDVRSNPGGVLDQAAHVSEYFLDHGTIVKIKAKNKKDDMVISAGRFVEKAPKVPMVVLINGGSASASEIVAGALQDHARAIIVGTTSFGKGLVQTFTPINDRAAVKLTTAKYFTPNGTSINGKGIKPDIYIESAKVEYATEDNKDSKFTSSSVKSYLKKYNKEENKEEGKEKKKSSKDKKEKKNKKAKNNKYKEDKDKNKGAYVMSAKYKEDYQYARAYDLIRGLIIANKQP
ncbi:MAG: S41 family peptidase [Rickettsiaceae bacterium]|nr:S41 family peptidase [Rickettsiaceae bacterium]